MGSCERLSLRRIFKSEPRLRKFLRELFLRVTPNKQIFFPGTNPNETAYTESYDGHTLTLFEDNAHSMLHEVCHHLLAAPERRGKVNWELGSSPFAPQSYYALSWDQRRVLIYKRDCLKVYQARDEEEIDVCRLEMALAKYLGCGSRLLKKRVQDLSFDEPPTADEIEALALKYPDALSSVLWAEVKACYVRKQKPSVSSTEGFLLLSRWRSAF